MKCKTRPMLAPTVIGFLLLWYAGGSGAQSFLATGADAEVTEDGLHRVDQSIMRAAWVKTDIDLTDYTNIFFLPTTVEFRDLVDQVRIARIGDTATHFEISEARQARLRERWGQILYEGLSAVDSYEMFDGVGRDVLLVQGRLVDVASGVPPIAAGSVITTVLYPWEAIIVLELRDSMSDELLARTADRRRLQGPIDATAIEALTGTMLRRWSLQLCTQLEELSDLSEL